MNSLYGTIFNTAVNLNQLLYAKLNQSLIDFKGKFNNFTIPLTKIANIR